jgi:two-component system LytT family response regulator
VSARVIRAIVADDEQLARDRIRRLLEEEPDVEVVAECADGDAAVEAIRAHRPDLALLDVQMPGRDGLAVVDALRGEAMPVVVFATAFDEYAIRAFEVHALDYLVKPFNPRRFRAAVARAREALVQGRGASEERLLALVQQLSEAQRDLERRLDAAGSKPAATERHEPWLDRITVRAKGRIHFVRAADVDWIGSAGNYVELHVGPAVHTVRESLTGLAARLDPGRFVRIHRTTVVNVDRIREIQPWFSGDYVVLMHSGAKLTMSRNYRHLVLKRSDA